MVLECGRVSKEIVMLESGGLAKHRVMAYMYGSMGIGMKEVSKTA
jgi:hypothetical protein